MEPKIYKPLEMMDEADLMDALSDPHWRLRNLYVVKDEQGRVVKFRPNEAQELFLDNIWYRNIIPKARQRGFSTLMAILALDYCLFQDNFAAAIIAETLALAKKILKNKILFAYDRLPPLIKSMRQLTVKNTDELAWSNGSSVYVSASPRGDTLQFLHVSELGKISLKYPDHADEITEGGFATVDKTGIIVIESTVESAAGVFPDMCRTARKYKEEGKKLAQSEYRLHFASWWDAPKYELDPRHITISSIDHAYFERCEAELGIDFSDRKRAWYVSTRDNTYNGDEAKMKRQFPTMLDEAFEVSADGLWLGAQMALARTQNRITDVPYDPSKPVNFFWDLGIDDDMAIWCHQENGDYDNFIDFIEGSDKPYAYFINEIQKRQFLSWGTFYLPHDANQRHQGAHVIKTPKDMLEDLGVRNIKVIPRTLDLENGGIEDLRSAFRLYRFDKTACKEGIEHLDGFSKVWSKKFGLWEGRIAKNGHQHAADALRQHSQMRHDIKRTLSIAEERRNRKKQSRSRSAMAS